MKPVLYFLDIGFESDVLPDAQGNGPGSILSAHPPGSELKTLVTNQPYPDGIEVSHVQKRMFWTNMGNPAANDGTVQSANLDGTDVHVVIPAGHVHTPKQICIDHTNSKLYFCDREGLRIHRCSFDGSDHEIIYQSGDWRDANAMKDQTLHCVGISIDLDHGFFYWTQKGPSKAGLGRLFRARITTPPDSKPDARPDVELLYKDLPEPIDLEIQPESQVLYWSDRGEYPKGNTLNRAYVGPCDTIPKQVQDANIAVWPEYDVITKHFHEAIGLKLDEVSQCVWMTDIGGAVYRVDLDGTNKTRIYDTERAFTGISVYYDSQN